MRYATDLLLSRHMKRHCCVPDLKQCRDNNRSLKIATHLSSTNLGVSVNKVLAAVEARHLVPIGAAHLQPPCIVTPLRHTQSNSLYITCQHRVIIAAVHGASQNGVLMHQCLPGAWSAAHSRRPPLHYRSHTGRQRFNADEHVLVIVMHVLMRRCLPAWPSISKS